jgi:DNA invertase Pin-like site-specific DNA recombinase
VIDTTTAAGKLLFQIMATVAEFEADIARERTIEDLEAARERHGGKLLPRGRGSKTTPEKLRNASRLLAAGVPATEVARTVGISRASLYRLGVVGRQAGAAS